MSEAVEGRQRQPANETRGKSAEISSSINKAESSVKSNPPRLGGSIPGTM